MMKKETRNLTPSKLSFPDGVATNQTLKKDDPLNSQIGGSHYKQYKIQPIEYAMANKLEYCEANVVKYVTRHQDKNGVEDIRKAIHNLEIILKLKYGQ